MDGCLPRPDDPNDPKWRWPWWKFRLPPDALFTTLHDRFNTRSCPIQEPYAFLLDVRECADQSAGVDEFYTKLAERRDQRRSELERAWDETKRRMEEFLRDEPICGFRDCKSRDEDWFDEHSQNDTRADRWINFCRSCSHMSFDRLVSFFDGFVRDKRKDVEERVREFYTCLGSHRRRKLAPDYSNPLVPPRSTRTDTMKKDPAEASDSAENPPHLCPPLSASSSTPPKQTPIQNERAEDGQTQASAIPRSSGKRSRSGLGAEENKEEADAESGHVPPPKRRRRSPPPPRRRPLRHRRLINAHAYTFADASIIAVTYTNTDILSRVQRSSCSSSAHHLGGGESSAEHPPHLASRDWGE
ncbi:hypothetical protein MYCTH_2305841 [Thermothelomyces thermophilus ATCC 42464]|uniref:Uncharacterized protein n=1 Tax=Thermothelomyces thermophilus (strain ATCC 42464 / BCRC 31852 / DSM 1799) TaxID=573729 RepID=G2QG17_THET4|nr:uncharacterized protein MYCTH_2305841 [Thermothelomyces thermophilus ATCC 42464]AEO58482.1 hypothetical protein MYCTH_2305841 [Thermothelomyces thermophilus ATCC 42464]